MYDGRFLLSSRYRFCRLLHWPSFRKRSCVIEHSYQLETLSLQDRPSIVRLRFRPKLNHHSFNAHLQRWLSEEKKVCVTIEMTSGVPITGAKGGYYCSQPTNNHHLLTPQTTTSLRIRPWPSRTILLPPRTQTHTSVSMRSPEYPHQKLSESMARLRTPASRSWLTAKALITSSNHESRNFSSSLPRTLILFK